MVGSVCEVTPSVCSLRSQPPSPRGRLNSLSQSLTALTAPSEREPLAYPQTLCPNRKLYRHAKGPILEGAVAAGDWGSIRKCPPVKMR